MQRAVIAGHICLDVIPEIDHPFTPEPGRLYEVGRAVMSTGGAVANTGLAMHRLGIPVTLMGKIGSDAFGRAVRDALRQAGPDLDRGLIESDGAVTSYTAVLNIPGRDRTFLHCPGANHSFTSADVPAGRLSGAALFHLGYPPLMAGLYREDGAELERLYRTVKAAGLTASMDMTVPDPGGPGGQVAWARVFERVLPLLDIFLPSADELLYAFDRDRFGAGDQLAAADLSALGDRMLAMGVAVAGIKLGARGLYIRTAGRDRIAAMGAAAPREPELWSGQELWFPVFQVPAVVGTTGAGDVTIAGFLAALLHGCGPETAGRIATAAGACNVQAADALSGLKPWAEIRQLLDDGWPVEPLPAAGPGWTEDPGTGIQRGPHHR